MALTDKKSLDIQTTAKTTGLKSKMNKGKEVVCICNKASEYIV